MLSFILALVFIGSLLPLSFGLPLAQRDPGTPKYVVAHFMVGNAYPYTLQDWLDDINQAHAAGIDAFALNIGSDSWQPARVADAYAAAQQSNTGFKMFFSFDMTVLPCASSADAAALRERFTTYANHPSQFTYNGKPFASTFAGENCNFGTGGGAAQAWQSNFKDPLPDSTFVPSFFLDPKTLGGMSALDGAFNWNGAWPITLTSASAGGLVSSLAASLPTPLAQLIGSLTPDNEYLAGLGLPGTGVSRKRDSGKIYMASASPTFFTHYGADSYNKNWIYLSDDHLYARKWENLVEARDAIPIVELLTWNDFGESSYLQAPGKGAQPAGTTWVDGFDHSGWLVLTKYYAEAYKTGAYPAVTKDQIVMWARPHSKNAQATSDSVPKPTNWELTTDTLWAVALLSQPGTVTLSTSPTNSQSFDLPAGASKISIPLTSGGNLHAVATRNGQTTVDVQSQGYSYQESTVPTYNFNMFVVASQ